jgi:hypothetical protein
MYNRIYKYMAAERHKWPTAGDYSGHWKMWVEINGMAATVREGRAQVKQGGGGEKAGVALIDEWLVNIVIVIVAVGRR